MRHNALGNLNGNFNHKQHTVGSCGKEWRQLTGTQLSLLDTFERKARSHFLLFSGAYDDSIYRVSLQVDGTPCEPLHLKNISTPVALAYDAEEERIYWTDITLQQISRAFFNGSSVEVIAKSNVSSPEGLALDLVAGNVYWTDTGTDRIEVARLDGSSRRGVVTSGLDEPRAISVYSSKG